MTFRIAQACSTVITMRRILFQLLKRLLEVEDSKKPRPSSAFGGLRATSMSWMKFRGTNICITQELAAIGQTKITNLTFKHRKVKVVGWSI